MDGTIRNMIGSIGRKQRKMEKKSIFQIQQESVLEENGRGIGRIQGKKNKKVGQRKRQERSTEDRRGQEVFEGVRR